MSEMMSVQMAREAVGVALQASCSDTTVDL
jgi:hypothetical protein